MLLLTLLLVCGALTVWIVGNLRKKTEGPEVQEQVREEQRADFFILGTADTVEGLEPGQVLTDQGVYEMEDAFVQQYLYTWVTARVMAVQGRQSSDAQNAEAEQSLSLIHILVGIINSNVTMLPMPVTMGVLGIFLLVLVWFGFQSKKRCV